MAVKRPKPPAPDSGKSRIVRRAASRPRTLITGPIFSHLTILWVQNNGVPFDTTGFTARLSRGGTLVSTASFDRYGVARFNNINTLTTVSYTLRLFSPSGVLFRTRTIPAGVETFAVIG